MKDQPYEYLFALFYLHHSLDLVVLDKLERGGNCI